MIEYTGITLSNTSTFHNNKIKPLIFAYIYCFLHSTA